MESINIELSYQRYNATGAEWNESYSNNFKITDEDTYYTILEKVEIMLKSLGYEFNGHLEFTGLVESDNNDNPNVIQFHPNE